MDQKLTIVFTVKKEEREYIFQIPMASPLGEAYDAAHEFLAFLAEEAKKAVDKSKNTEQNIQS
jgi:hypothetical protein